MVFVFCYIVLTIQILNVFLWTLIVKKKKKIERKKMEKAPFANFPDSPILSGNIMLMKMVSDN